MILINFSSLPLLSFLHHIPVTMKHFFTLIYFVCLSVAYIAASGRYLSQQEAIDIDAELFKEYQFTVEQLMELAGLSAASAIANAYKPGRVLVCVGPGNNGGDGLVCARHLKMFDFKPVIYAPKKIENDTLNAKLMHQCNSMNITTLRKLPSEDKMNHDYDLIVDALFGFSFKPPLRPEYIPIMSNLWATATPICSIDIPSGWHVELGPTVDSFRPKFLISLTAPKQCAKFFDGKFHYLGGRFLPPALQKKYNLTLPEYPKDKCFVRLKG